MDMDLVPELFTSGLQRKNPLSDKWLGLLSDGIRILQFQFHKILEFFYSFLYMVLISFIIFLIYNFFNL